MDVTAPERCAAQIGFSMPGLAALDVRCSRQAHYVADVRTDDGTISFACCAQHRSQPAATGEVVAWRTLTAASTHRRLRWNLDRLTPAEAPILPHPHRWLIGTAMHGRFPGRCRICGAERVFLSRAPGELPTVKSPGRCAKCGHGFRSQVHQNLCLLALER